MSEIFFFINLQKHLDGLISSKKYWEKIDARFKRGK